MSRCCTCTWVVTIEVACAQFRALSDQLYGTPAHHGQVRRAAVAQLRAHPDAYAPFVDSDWDAYLRDMARQGTWGDHLTLQVRPAQTTPATCNDRLSAPLQIRQTACMAPKNQNRVHKLPAHARAECVPTGISAAEGWAHVCRRWRTTSASG